MSFSKLVRNLYTYPDSGGFPAPHDSLHHSQDLDNFHLPQSRMHNLHLHDWGIARGLDVGGTIGGTQLTISPGVAVGRNGEIIALAPDGHASLIPAPSDPSDLVAVPVIMTLPTLDNQPRYLTIEYMEFLDTSGGSGAWVEVVPRIRLQPTTGTDAYTADSASIVLAIVRVDATGRLASLQAVESGLPFRRRLIGEQAETLSIRRPALTSGKADELPAGKISGRDAGGLQITVPNHTDTVLFAQEDGTTFSGIELRADTITARDSGSRDVLQLDSNSATLRVGAANNAGDLVVRDAAGTDSVIVTGSTGTIAARSVSTGTLSATTSVSAPSVSASTSVSAPSVSASNTLSAPTVNGTSVNATWLTASTSTSTGTAYASTTRTNRLGTNTGNILEVDASFLRLHAIDFCLDGRSGGNKRALVDNSNELVINFDNDYANGVRIGKLHTWDHVRTSTWWTWDGWNPGRNAWHTFYEFDTGLPANEWQYATMCEICMRDNGSSNNYFWLVNNASYTSAWGTIVIKWNIWYRDDGTDYYPYGRCVFWMAVRY